jgi:hypothetical protein
MLTNENLNKIYEIVNGIEYSRDVPEEAKKIARENNIVIIVGGSDDLMYCYGAKSYLTDYIEHGYGNAGEDLSKVSDENLKCEAKQLGLQIFWCGDIYGSHEKYKNYDSNIHGSFQYKVKEGIDFKEFTVYEDEYHTEVYCTGMILQLPKSFKPCLEE